MSDGEYNLSLDELKKEYNIIVTDPEGKYEKKAFSLLLSGGDIGQIKNIMLNQSTDLFINVRTDDGEVLSNASVYINGEQVGKTNHKGDFLHRLSLTKDELGLKITKKGYVYESEKIALLPGSNSHISYFRPITYGFKILDSVSEDFVEGLDIDSGTFIKKDKEGSVYWIQFEQFGNNSFKLSDPSGEYQDSEYTVEIKKNELETVKELIIHKMTYLSMEIVDDFGKPISGVTIKQVTGRKLGVSGRNGKVRKNIYYSTNTYRYSIKFHKYFHVDTLVNIVPGENKITQRLIKLPEMVFNFLNKHNNQSITDLSIMVNDKNYFTDKKGRIAISPDVINGEYEITFNDKDIEYYRYSNTFVYTPLDAKPVVKLRPVAYLNIKTYYLDGETPMTGVNLFFNDKRLDIQKNKAEYDKKISTLNQEYIIKAEKEEYETKEITVTPSEIHTEIKFTLDQLTETLMIVNVFDNPIKDVTVRYAGTTSKVDKYGKVELVPKRINKPMKIDLISPEDIYRDTTVTYTFSKNRETRKIVLFTNPFDLAVTIKNKIGIPAAGSVTINPPPNPTKGAKYELADGKVNIDIFESKNYWLTYEVSFGIGGNKYFVTDKKKIEVELSEKRMDFRQTIRGAILKAETNNSELLNITYLKNPQLTYRLKGDGIDELEISEFGDYEFSYQPSGFNQPIKEVRTVNRPNQFFYFRVDDNFERGIIAEVKGDEETACNYFLKVPVGSPNYCEAVTKCIQISYDNSNLKSAEEYLWQYINAMMKTECGENFSYYFKYIEVASKVRNPEETDMENIEYYNKRWGEDEGQMDRAYDRFRNLCPILSRNCEEKEKQAKILILRGIAGIMVQTKDIYDVELDHDITRSCKDLNMHLYNISKKYSMDLRPNEWSSERSQIERALIN